MELIEVILITMGGQVRTTWFNASQIIRLDPVWNIKLRETGTELKKAFKVITNAALTDGEYYVDLDHPIVKKSIEDFYIPTIELKRKRGRPARSIHI